MAKHILVFFASIISLASLAQDIPTDTIETIILSSSKIKTPLQKSTYTIHPIRIDELKTISQLVSINEYIEGVPGLFAQNARNYAQDLRISIRGFGARSSFGIRGIKLVVDGIPETTPDGQGQIDNLDLGIIEGIEVIRGPSSGLYGNASGGVVSISTVQKIEKDFLRFSSSLGSFNTLKTQLAAGKIFNKTDVLISANHLRSDGYREHSAVVSTQFSANVIHKLNKKHTIKLLSSYTYSPTAEDPGGLSLENVSSDRTKAFERNLLYDAGEAISHFKSALQYEGKPNKKHHIKSQIFYANRRFEGRLPFEFGGIIELDRHYGGHSTSYSYNTVFENGINNFIIGYDMAIQHDARARFNNNNSEKGRQSADQTETFNNLAAFVINRVEMSNGLIINLNARFDNNRLATEDKAMIIEDLSGSKTMNTLNYGAGLNYQIVKWLQPYLRFGTSFETPTLSELTTTENNIEGFNQDLDAQKSSTYDLGIRGNGRHLSYEATGFFTQTKDEIVSYEFTTSSTSRTVFRNAGKTERYGLETSLSYQSNKGLIINGSCTVAKYKFKEYQVNNLTYDGQSLPGIPDIQGSLSLSYPVNDNLFLRWNSTYTGQIFLNDVNSNSYDPFVLSSFSTRYKVNLGRHALSLFGGVNNVFNSDYMDNLRTNAFGGRFYEPGPGRNFYLGVRYGI